jgi:uncharacterized protein YceH (UPF0502 family)
LDIILSAVEVRILGCLIEKQATTPDVYPLSLNSLVSACNQSSNREPVMDLGVDDVTAALDSLQEKTLASLYQSGRSRTEKYQHRLHQRAFDEFNFSKPELAVLSVLFLRGAQTVGEIRTRCARVYEFPDLDAVHTVLRELEENTHGPYVTMLPRQAGRKEPRFMHLFCGEPDADAMSAPAVQSSARVSSSSELESEVQELKQRLRALEQRFEDFVTQFE